MLSLMLALLVLAGWSSASPVVSIDAPVVTLPLCKLLNFASGHDLIRQERAHAHAFLATGKTTRRAQSREISDSTLHDFAVGYVAPVHIGSPGAQYTLILDMGSSNTWIGARKPYVRTRTSKQTLNQVDITYANGSFHGVEFLDTVDLGGGLIVPSQSIGASRPPVDIGIENVDGVLGLGPTDLTRGTLFPSIFDLVPTITDQLYKDGTIPAREIGLFLRPHNSAGPSDGEITWGGVDSSEIVSNITWSPVASTAPASKYWGIDQSISYGGSIVQHRTAGIINPGSTFIMLSTDAFERYQEATGAEIDEDTGFLRISPGDYEILESLVFDVGGTSFELTPNAQLWPRDLNKLIGGEDDGLYLAVINLGTKSGEGMDFVNGMPFLQRFYSAYDSTNKRVGLAPTPFTNDETN